MPPLARALLQRHWPASNGGCSGTPFFSVMMWFSYNHHDSGAPCLLQRRRKLG